jgi:FkbM family methyltransferase
MPLPTKIVEHSALGIDFEILASDTIIGPAIERGLWEEHETRLFRAHLVPGARVLDLGANIGWFSAIAILAGCDVQAFEPVPDIADVCQRNIDRAMRAGKGRGVLHRAAAGDQPGKARIALARANFGDNRVLDPARPRPADMGEGELLEIDVVRVDDAAPGSYRVIKIDTQGSEWLALQGARATLAQSRAVALLIEFWPYALRGGTPEALLALLVESGFTLGKATAAPYPMDPARILRQARARDEVKGGLDLYATRALPFHVGGVLTRARALARSLRED